MRTSDNVRAVTAKVLRAAEAAKDWGVVLAAADGLEGIVDTFAAVDSLGAHLGASDEQITQAKAALSEGPSDPQLFERLKTAEAALRNGVIGDDENGELAEWFRPAFLREVATDLRTVIAIHEGAGPDYRKMLVWVMEHTMAGERLNTRVGTSHAVQWLDENGDDNWSYGTSYEEAITKAMAEEQAMRECAQIEQSAEATSAAE